MKAMILAAGYGKRLLPLTEKKPKSLIKIGDKSLIQRNIEHLINNGFNEIIINVSYLGDQVVDHVQDAFPDENIWINNMANQNLATAGSGDVLCGIIAGLLAQKMTIEDALPASLFIQSKISKSKKNVVVEDFIGEIPIVINSLKK